MLGREIFWPAKQNLEREGVSKRKRGKREKVNFNSPDGFSDRKSEQ